MYDGHRTCPVLCMAQFPRHASRGVRGAKPPGGIWGAAGPPNGGPSLQRGGMREGGSGGFLRGSSHGDDVIPHPGAFFGGFSGGDHVFRWLKEG